MATVLPTLDAAPEAPGARRVVENGTAASLVLPDIGGGDHGDGDRLEGILHGLTLPERVLDLKSFPPLSGRGFQSSSVSSSA